MEKIELVSLISFLGGVIIASIFLGGFLHLEIHKNKSLTKKCAACILKKKCEECSCNNILKQIKILMEEV